MSVSSAFLVNILQLELREVEHDLNGLKDLYSNRHNSSEITNYVFLENTALLQAELSSIQHLGLCLGELNKNNHSEPKEMLIYLDNFLKEEIERKQYSEAIYNFVKSKLAKISKYLEM